MGVDFLRGGCRGTMESLCQKPPPPARILPLPVPVLPNIGKSQNGKVSRSPVPLVPPIPSQSLGGAGVSPVRCHAPRMRGAKSNPAKGANPHFANVWKKRPEFAKHWQPLPTISQPLQKLSFQYPRSGFNVPPLCGPRALCASFFPSPLPSPTILHFLSEPSLFNLRFYGLHSLRFPPLCILPCGLSIAFLLLSERLLH